jgi:hypothetical protein
MMRHRQDRTRPIRRMLHALPVATTLLGAACDGASLSAPPDTGAVVVRVRDEQAAPLAGVGVRIQMPNTSGGLFEVGSTTRADGSWTVTAVPAGARRVTVTPPTGYAASAEPLARVVTVVAGETTPVDFVLRRATGAVRVAAAVPARR